MATTLERQSRQTPLQKAREELGQLNESKRALQGQIDQFGIQLAREGKLSRTARTELSQARRQLRSVESRLRVVDRRYEREAEKEQARLDRQRERQEAQANRERDQRKRKVARLAATANAKARRQARFALLPKGAKPSKALSPFDNQPIMREFAKLAKVGKGNKARWAILAGSGQRAVVVDLDVSAPNAVRECLIPADALKAIEKAGAFRITPRGGIQPLKVAEGYGEQIRVDSDAYTAEWTRVYTAESVGTAFMVPDDRDPKKYPDVVGKIPKAPAKSNQFTACVNVDLLQEVAQAGGAKTLCLTFDLSKAGKASQGRKATEPIRVTGPDGSGLEAVVCPLTPRS